MVRIFYITLFCLFIVSCKQDNVSKSVKSNFVQNKNLKDYINFKYDEVIAFASVNPMDYYDGDFDKELNVKKFKDTISKTLNLSQIKHLNDILSGRENKNPFTSVIFTDCFYPRHNIIFLKDKKVINYISVCFECNNIKSSKPPRAHIKNYLDFFNSINLRMFNNPIEHSKYYDSIKFAHINNLNKKK
ncbi:hypothetical protein [Chryseobacterium limigenitum]|uniref:Lipoprotein n=1 Tax=Chryseobacterium limigenitum TaxID=1612149 RepID=A0A1K2IT28_9FLAO|nr:hypothetical protein [Chryseobacterium limigenitum]SFZ94875.1 hypothetical protein SAMN05216324_10819 [Chryseobacterium limigenitum]